MKTTGLPAPQSVNASFTPGAASMKSPTSDMARAGAGCAPMASSAAAASKPALSVVDRVDFNRVRRSILVIPDVAVNIATMTQRMNRDDYVRGNKMDVSVYCCRSRSEWHGLGGGREPMP